MAQFERLQMLIGKGSLDFLAEKKVIIFGIGGVGGYAAEALARSGIGTLELVDDDEVAESNINRQIIALYSTINKPKVEVMSRRIADINPACKVITSKAFYAEDNANLFPLEDFDFIIDAIDTVTSKLLLIEKAQEKNVPIISCMGTGNKFDPTMLRVERLEKTSGCPLARVMRLECRKRRLKNVMVLYSLEPPLPLAEPVAEK
ncbi:MAG: tRNA threonylcarbamoyladenosine dehydratase, partial [Oscillospiraceae bacterium]